MVECLKSNPNILAVHKFNPYQPAADSRPHRPTLTLTASERPAASAAAWKLSFKHPHLF
jgi:hypothetical protein